MDLTDLKQHGFAVLTDFLPTETTNELRRQAEKLQAINLRFLFKMWPEIRLLAGSQLMLGLAKEIVGADARAVRSTLFDKTPTSNWKVPAHQDCTVFVKEKVEGLAGFGPWTVKEDHVSVQPSAEVLSSMIAFRLHLDDCNIENGPLRIWPGSHLHGRLGDAGIEEWICTSEPKTCPVSAGGLLIMHPLLIHASSAANVPGHRRVVHIDYAPLALPGGLEWLDAVGDDD